MLIKYLRRCHNLYIITLVASCCLLHQHQIKKTLHGLKSVAYTDAFTNSRPVAALLIAAGLCMVSQLSALVHSTQLGSYQPRPLAERFLPGPEQQQQQTSLADSCRAQ